MPGKLVHLHKGTDEQQQTTISCDLCQHILFLFIVIYDLCQHGQHFLSLSFHRKKLLFVICANTFHFHLLWFVICASADNIFCPCPSIEKNCYLWFIPTYFISVYCDLWFMPARTIFFCPCPSIEKIVICDLCQHISGTDRLGGCWLLLLSLSYNSKKLYSVYFEYCNELHKGISSAVVYLFVFERTKHK